MDAETKHLTQELVLERELASVLAPQPPLLKQQTKRFPARALNNCFRFFALSLLPPPPPSSSTSYPSIAITGRIQRMGV